MPFIGYALVTFIYVI